MGQFECAQQAHRVQRHVAHVVQEHDHGAHAGVAEGVGLIKASVTGVLAAAVASAEWLRRGGGGGGGGGGGSLNEIGRAHV